MGRPSGIEDSPNISWAPEQPLPAPVDRRRAVSDFFACPSVRRWTAGNTWGKTNADEFPAAHRKRVVSLSIHEKSNIHCAAVLAAAELIEANLPEPNDSTGRGGVILRITPMGRAELKRLREALG